MSNDPSDETLFEAARRAPEGDTRAFDELVRRHQGKIVANCRFISRRPNEAEDLAQEVFVKAYFARGRFEGRSSFRTWLQRIKVNHCLNDLHKRRGRRFVDLDDVGEAAHEDLVVDARAEREVERDDDRRAIERSLDGMSDTLRVPLVLRDLDHWSYQEIADALGIGLSAVKMRIKRAREEFRERFRVEFGTGPEVGGP